MSRTRKGQLGCWSRRPKNIKAAEAIKEQLDILGEDVDYSDEITEAWYCHLFGPCEICVICDAIEEEV